MYELRAIIFHSRESMKILDEMFAGFHHTFSFFPFPEKLPMHSHSIEYFTKSWFIIVCKKTPRVTKWCSSNHESVEIFFLIIRMHELLFPILITHDISIAYHRNPEMLLQLIYAIKICFSSECLLISTPMNTDKICSSIFESCTKLHKKWVIFPAKSCFYGYRYFHSLTHLFYYTECCISIDHERWTMSTFYNFFCRTSHIDINSSYSIAFYDFCSFCEFLRILTKYLNNQGIFIYLVCKSFLLEVFRVYEAISTIKLRKYDSLGSNIFYDLTVGTITITIHGSECCYRSVWSKIFPKVFVHSIDRQETRGIILICKNESIWNKRTLYIQKIQKSNFSLH